MCHHLTEESSEGPMDLSCGFPAEEEQLLMGWSHKASNAANMAMSGFPPLKSALNSPVAFQCYGF